MTWEEGARDYRRKRGTDHHRWDFPLRCHLDPKNVDLQVIGVILMIGGAARLCVAIGLMLMRRRDPGAAEVTEQRRYVEPPM